ncbi:hypothetical protein AALP_AA7G132500 [Arabis alpina]|uniref:BHLH domain-containing protein n=1 Tax=Arabis alpina TaxID=50452 RepID=A0A087GHR8_ARAAL|nr:hypothetical protein AALP_AA7G132500 [Arabis alpina]
MVRVLPTFVVPSLGRKEKAVVSETTEPVMETADPKEREETEEARGSMSRKRSRIAKMHNLYEQRRREKIKEMMKAIQELIIPPCNKSNKASMLDDAIHYMKSLQMHLQMMSTRGNMMPATYAPDMQQFMAHMAMGMNRPPFIPYRGTPPFPSQAHMAGVCPPYPFPAHGPSRIHIPTSQQPDPVSNQPQFSGYLNPYTQFAGIQQMQQPPPLQNQTISQPSLNQASSSEVPEDQEN